MESSSIKMAISRFRKRAVTIGILMFYAPLIWLVYIGEWKMAVVLFLVVCGNNLCVAFNKNDPYGFLAKAEKMADE